MTNGNVEISIEMLQRIWANLYYDEDEAGFTFQQTLNEVVDLLAANNALPSIDGELERTEKSK